MRNKFLVLVTVNFLEAFLKRSFMSKYCWYKKTFGNSFIYSNSFNPLSVNPRKCSNILKQFDGCWPTNCLSVFDHFVGLTLKGLRTPASSWNRSITRACYTALLLTGTCSKEHLVNI